MVRPRPLDRTLGGNFGCENRQVSRRYSIYMPWGLFFARIVKWKRPTGWARAFRCSGTTHSSRLSQLVPHMNIAGPSQCCDETHTTGADLLLLHYHQGRPCQTERTSKTQKTTLITGYNNNNRSKIDSARQHHGVRKLRDVASSMMMMMMMVRMDRSVHYRLLLLGLLAHARTD
jgi:hypothetical protein